MSPSLQFSIAKKITTFLMVVTLRINILWARPKQTQITYIVDKIKVTL